MTWWGWRGSDTNLEDGSIDDADGHADDLLVTFTETGVGNGKASDITVTAVRGVTVTCLSALGEFRVDVQDPVSIHFSDGEAPGVSASFSSDDDGHLVGVVPIRTTFGTDICPEFDPTSDTQAHVYAYKDYTLTYTDVTVTDNENGGASATLDRADPSYTDPNIVTFGAGTSPAGFSCTVESLESGHCESD